MALVRLQDVDWTLTDKRQDIRGRELRDAVGRSLGEIEHMIVDTDQERVVTVRLTDATEYPADDLQIMEDAVYYIPPDVPAAEPGVAEPVASASVASPTDGSPRPVDAEAPAPEARDIDDAVVADPAIPPPAVVAEPSDPAIPAPPDAAGPSAGLAGFTSEEPAVAPPAIVEPSSDPAIPAPPDPEEPMPAPAAEPQAPGAYLDADFRNHFAAEYDDRRLRYGDLQFAYRFGFDAARTPRLAEQALPDAEAALRRVFYARFNYPANDELVWAVAGDAVRYGFRLGKR